MTEQMHCPGLVKCDWRLSDRQSRQFSNGSRSSTIEYGEPFWQIDFEYYAGTPSEKRSLEAYLQRLGGGATEFQAWRLDRQKPLNIADADTLTGAAVSALSSNQLRITTGSNHYSEGDMIAYDAAVGRFVGQVKRVVASGVNYVDVETRPTRQAVAVTPNLEIYRAHGVFKMLRQTLKISGGKPAEPLSVSFTARQVEP